MARYSLRGLCRPPFPALRVETRLALARRFDLQKPFAKDSGWLAWALLGMLAAPAVLGAVTALISLLQYDALPAAQDRGTVDGVAGMITMDWPTYLSLLAVTGVLAPVLEETVFRYVGDQLGNFVSYNIHISLSPFSAAYASEEQFESGMRNLVSKL